MIDILIIIAMIILIGLISILFEKFPKVVIVISGFLLAMLSFYISRNVADKNISLILNYASTILIVLTLFSLLIMIIEDIEIKKK